MFLIKFQVRSRDIYKGSRTPGTKKPDVQVVHTRATDTYSFGISVLEILTGLQPSSMELKRLMSSFYAASTASDVIAEVEAILGLIKKVELAWKWHNADDSFWDGATDTIGNLLLVILRCVDQRLLPAAQPRPDMAAVVESLEDATCM